MSDKRELSESIEGILLLGSSGFIGSKFLRVIQELDVPVITLSSRANEDEIKSILHSEVEHSTDVSKYICVSFAAAGASGGAFSESDYFFNSEQIVNIFETIRSFGVNQFIAFGSCFEYGISGNSIDFLDEQSPTNPVEQYGKSKLEGFRNLSRWANANKVHLLYLRLFQVFGEGEVPVRFYPSLMRAIESESDFVVMQPDLVRDFLHVNRIVEETLIRLSAIQSIRYVGVENICSGKPTTLWSFAEGIWADNLAKGNLTKAKEPTAGIYRRLVGTTKVR